MVLWELWTKEVGRLLRAAAVSSLFTSDANLTALSNCKQGVPFEGFAVGDITEWVMNGKRPEIPISAASVRKVIEQCWAEEPRTRPSFSDLVGTL